LISNIVSEAQIEEGIEAYYDIPVLWIRKIAEELK